MRRSFRGWAWVWAGWTALAVFFAVSSSLTYLSTGRPANWSLTIARALSEWWLWALLTPIVVRLARHFPLHGARWRRSLVAHTVAGVVVAFAKTIADRAAFALMTDFWMYLLASTFALQFVVYAAIVAGAHGVEYYRRSREREQLERRLAETRLQLLNMQLQPHFLFNTLNTIAELVHEDAEAADRMITALSDLLRQTLDLRAAQEIPLDMELRLLGTYLEIQKTRFGDRLQVHIARDEDVANAHVPVLLLQPLVENAIRHGLAAHRHAGRVRIEARRDAGALLIAVVIDDGPGAAEEAVIGREGVGLGNTRARLNALYGPAHAFELANIPGGGARVSIRLPFRTTAEGVA